jgi:hypothetical protein
MGRGAAIQRLEVGGLSAPRSPSSERSGAAMLRASISVFTSPTYDELYGQPRYWIGFRKDSADLALGNQEGRLKSFFPVRSRCK